MQNANAYLLFYRRRSNDPLGGKTHAKVEEYKAKAPEDEPDLEPGAARAGDGQLPTPPDEPYDKARSVVGGLIERWSETGSHGPSASDPPDFEEAQSDLPVSDSYDDILPYAHSYTLPDRYRKSSPTSSNEAEVDPDLDRDDWDPNFTDSFSLDHDNDIDVNWVTSSAQDSPSLSEPSAGSPLEDDLYDDDRNADIIDEKDESKTT